jgi:hypothetical protein
VQADIFGPCFYLCLRLLICFQEVCLGVGFGMFCLFRAALLSASVGGGVLAWDGPNEKGILFGGRVLAGAVALLWPFWRIVLSLLLILSRDGGIRLWMCLPI